MINRIRQWWWQRIADRNSSRAMRAASRGDVSELLAVNLEQLAFLARRNRAVAICGIIEYASTLIEYPPPAGADGSVSVRVETLQ